MTDRKTTWLRRRPNWRKISYGGIVILVGLLVIKKYWIGYYRIPQNAMFPTIRAGGALFAFRNAYSNPSQVKRGDLIVFLKHDRGQKSTYIFRVIGVPGDSISASGEALVVNGKPAVRERLETRGQFVIFMEHVVDSPDYEIAFDQSSDQHPPDVTERIPQRYFFVMGDNRLHAYDSRYFGPISFDSIVAKGIR